MIKRSLMIFDEAAPLNITKLRDVPNERAINILNDKFEIKEISSLRDVLARLNQKPDHILSDPKVRAALISGCDRESYNQTLLRGTFITGSAPVPPSLDYGFDQMKDPNSYNPERAAAIACASTRRRLSFRCWSAFSTRCGRLSEKSCQISQIAA